MIMDNNTLSSNRGRGIIVLGGIKTKAVNNSVSYNTYEIMYSRTANNVAKYNNIYYNSYGMNVTDGATVNAEYNY